MARTGARLLSLGPHRLFAENLPLLLCAAAPRLPPLSRRAHGRVMEEFRFFSCGDYNHFPLAAAAGFDQPADPDLAWKAALLAPAVTFPQVVQRLQQPHEGAGNRRLPLED